MSKSPLRPTLVGTATRNGAAGSGRRSSGFGRTLLVVVPLTLLIWAYAENAQNRPDTITTKFQLVAADPNLAVTSLEATDGRLNVNLTGPRGQIDLLRRRIEAAPFNGRLTVNMSSAESAVGETTVDLTARLKELPLFANSGVTVNNTTPSQVRVTVDPIISREVAVALPRELPVTLQGYSFDPPKLTVRGPAPAVNAEFGGEAPTIAVDVNPLRGMTPGKESALDVTVTPPRDTRIAVTPTRVRMAFVVGSTVSEAVVRSVGILIERPLGEDGSTVVTMRSRVINNVKIRGPANLVSQYVGEQPEKSLKAVLQVSQAYAGQGEMSRPVLFPSADTNRGDSSRGVQYAYKDAGITILDEPYEVQFEVTELPRQPGR